jgi:hypothetical protein
VLEHVRHLGEMCSVKSHEVRALGIRNLMPHDLTDAERRQWRRDYIEYLFREGMIDRRCSACGHDAGQCRRSRSQYSSERQHSDDDVADHRSNSAICGTANVSSAAMPRMM